MPIDQLTVRLSCSSAHFHPRQTSLQPVGTNEAKLSLLAFFNGQGLRGHVLVVDTTQVYPHMRGMLRVIKSRVRVTNDKLFSIMRPLGIQNIC